MTASYSAIGGLTRYKVVVVGAPGVGKTCLVRTWAREPLPDQCIPTTEVWSDSVRMGMEAELIIYDVGATVASTMVEDILAKTDAVVLVYDHCRLDKTLGVLDKDWIPIITARAKASALFLLVACNVPFDPVINHSSPPPEKVVTWWQRLTRTDSQAVMVFPTMYHMRDYSEVSRWHL